MNFTCGGGSSSVFSSALKALVREHVHLVEDVDLVARRAGAVAHALDQLAHVVDAGAAWRRPSRSRRRGGPRRSPVQFAQTPQGSGVGPPWPSGPVQLSARAMMRAVVVLPTPRMPVSRKACAMRPVAKALLSVRTSASWPISSPKAGRAGTCARAPVGRAAVGGWRRACGCGHHRPAGVRRRGPRREAGRRPGPKLVTAASFRT